MPDSAVWRVEVWLLARAFLREAAGLAIAANIQPERPQRPGEDAFASPTFIGTWTISLWTMSQVVGQTAD